MNQPDLFNDWAAKARTTDPVESHEAADSVTSGSTNEAARLILHWIHLKGNLNDQQIIDYAPHREDGTIIGTTESRIRSVRKILQEWGFVERHGTGKTKSGGKCSQWCLSGWGSLAMRRRFEEFGGTGEYAISWPSDIQAWLLKIKPDSKEVSNVDSEV